MSVKMCLQFFKLCFIFAFFVFTKGEKNEECGLVTKPKDNRIVGGEIIGYMKYPWFAALFLATNVKQIVCGGSLIHKRHVITAAHCFKPFFESVNAGTKTLEELYVVKLGTDNTCVQEIGIEIYETSKVYIHEKYYEDKLYYDIALMYLNQEVNDYMPACLPPARFESNNRTNLPATIVGLGKEASSAWRTPCQVKEAKVNIVADTTCQLFLDKFNMDGSKMHDAFCAGTGLGDIDTCQGDSGGPLQVIMEDNRYMVLGITSYGFGCARKDTYGVYTDISHFLGWIKNNIEFDKHFIPAAKQNPVTPSSTIKPKAVKKIQKRQRKQSIFQQILNW